MAYRSKKSGTSTQPNAEYSSADERLNILTSGPRNPFPKPPPYPWPPPFNPWPGPGPTFPEGGDRDAMGATALLAVSDPELLKRIYCKPEYRAVIQLFGASLLKRLDADPEAMLAFKEFLKILGVDLDQNDRFIPILIGIAVGASFFGGCTLGYLAEKGKAGTGKETK